MTLPTRRVARPHATFAPSFLLGTCDWCHRHRVLVGEAQRGHEATIYVVCMDCGLSAVTQRTQRVIRRALVTS